MSQRASHSDKDGPPADATATRCAVTIGVDVGGSSIKWVALDGTQIVARGSAATPQTSREDVLHAVADLVRAHPDATAVGLALPGVIDVARSVSVLVPNLPGSWSDEPIAAPLSAALGLPVTLCNDARAFAIAEQQLGAARGIDHVVAVTLGTGVGCGIITNGRLVHGRGELGHVKVNPSDTPCGCGLTGCLETVASATAIVRQAREAIATGGLVGIRSAGQPTSLDSPAEELTAKAVVDAAHAGDVTAARILLAAGEALGTALAALVTALGTQVVVIGGGLCSALDLLTPVIQAPISERAAVIGECRVVASSLGLHAGAIGAALWKENKHE